jgi:hypothetical protein
MIKLASERVFPLHKGPDHVPRLRGGKKVHPSTLYRWGAYGVRADDGEIIYLETIRVGRTICTSVDAIQRFCERLSRSRSDRTEPRTSVIRDHGVESATEKASRIFGSSSASRKIPRVES